VTSSDHETRSAAAGAAAPAAVLEGRGPVAVITLNRPHAMNAVNAELARAAGDALADFAADPELRVCVITGAGRAFCAGADLEELAAGRSVHDAAHPERGFAGIVRQFVDKPVIAAVNGFALGGGTEIVLACDLAVLSDQARLGLPEVTRGLVAGAGGLLRLHLQIPPKVAAEAVFTGGAIDPETALRWGLANRVVPAADVLGTALGLAEAIAANAPLAIRASKRIMARSAGGSDWADEVWAMNEAELADVRGSRDAREGATAFAQKRRPEWSGT
jgi:crotonobetainyl-CoA hydratase